MTLDDGTADRQTDAQAMRFGRVERLEQFVDAARIQADAGVLHEQLDAVARHRSPSEPGVFSAGPRCRSMASAAFNSRFRMTCCSCTRSPLMAGRDSANSVCRTELLRRSSADGNGNHLLRRIVEVDPLHGRRLLGKHRPQTLDHLRGAIGVPDRPPDRLGGSRDVGRVCRQHPRAGVGIGEDTGDRLAHLVRNGGGHRAQRGEPRHMRQLQSGLIERFVGPCAVDRDTRDFREPVNRDLALVSSDWPARADGWR